MARRFLCIVLVPMCAALAFQATAWAASGTCSTRGLQFPAAKSAKVKVVSLRAEGLPCSTARTIATRVARDVLQGKGITVSGAVGFGISQESCTGCGGTTTSISISYPHGKITVSLRGGGIAGGFGGGTTPTPGIPSLPSPGGGSGPVI
ncbi:MAG TPA: hypothetical protein VGM80_00515 [Gaiellaceae bacterium]|jgi:hypothetical protein